MALMSGKTYSNTGTPSNADGVDGDIFMQLDGLKTTYRKEGGVWTAFGNQLGTIPEFLKGVGVPSNSLGADNQYYREVNTEVIYEKQAGVWTNIGSWTSLEIQQLLQSNGIGADLAVTNIILNIDSFADEGAEGYYNVDTLGVKPSAAGFCKVWRGGSTLIGQRVQTTTNLWATRFSTDGLTWGGWRITANQDGDATRKFKALAGVAADDTVVVQQLTDAIQSVENNLAGIPRVVASVVFDGTGTILSSYNVASVYKDTTGRFTITLTATLDSLDYALAFSAVPTSSDTIVVSPTLGGTYTTNALQIDIWVNTATPTLASISRASVVFFL